MELKLILSDDKGFSREYTLTRSSGDEKKNLNDFIIEAIQVSEDKRKLPFMIQCPNGEETHPSLKMKFENYGHPMCGDKIEAMHVTWRK